MGASQEILHGKRIAHRAEEIWGWGTPAGQVRAKRRQDYLLRQGQAAQAARILEIGCGTGLFTEALRHSGAMVVGLDISWDLLHQACRNRDVRVFVGDAERLPFPDRTFDLVVGVSVLHHLNLRAAVPEIRRVLKPGGRIAFTEPNMMNPQILIQKNIPWVKRWLGDTPDETAFFRWWLARRMRDAGFTDVQVEPFDFLHPWTPRGLISAVAATGAVLESLPVLREFAGSLLIAGAAP